MSAEINKADTEVQKTQFATRLDRIKRGDTELPEGLISGEEMVAVRAIQQGKVVPKRVRKAIEKKPKPALSKFLMVFAAGALAYLAGQVIHFPYSEAPPAPTDRVGFVITVFGALGLTAVLMGLTFLALRIKAKSLVATAVLGCGAMFMAEPFLAHAAPQLWAGLYSQDEAILMSAKASESAAQLGFELPAMPWIGVAMAGVETPTDGIVQPTE